MARIADIVGFVAVFFAGGLHLRDLADRVVMVDVFILIRLVGGIVHGADAVGVELGDVERHGVALARLVVREGLLHEDGIGLVLLMHGDVIDVGMTLLIEGVGVALRIGEIDAGEELIVGRGDGQDAVFHRVLEFGRDAVDHAGNGIRKIIAAAGHDLLGLQALEDVLADRQVGIELKNDLRAVRERNGLAGGIGVHAVEHERGIGRKRAVFLVEDGLEAVRRIIHVVDLARFGIARDHDDVARVADDGGHHNQLVAVGFVRIGGHGDARIVELPLLKAADRGIARIKHGLIVCVDQIGHGGRGVDLPGHIVQRIVGILGIDLDANEIAPVVRLEDRSGSPVAVEGEERGVHILVIRLEVDIAFDEGAVFKEHVEITALHLFGEGDRHVDGLGLAGREGDRLRRVEGVIHTLFQQHGLHRVVQVVVRRVV